MRRFNNGELPWHGGVGMTIKDCNTTEEVIKKSKLDFTVDKCELYAQMPFVADENTKLMTGDFAYDGNIYSPCPMGYATYRTDKHIPLGVVKSKYEVVQNIDAFNFIDGAIGKDKAIFDTAGCFGYGARVFITAKLPVTTTVGDDPIDNYLVFSTSHDGSSSIDVLFTPVRVFCTNCMPSALREADAHIRIKHTKTAKDRLDFGSEMLHTAIKYADNAKQVYDSLLTVKMNDDEVRDYIARLTLTPSEYADAIKESKNYTIRKLFERDYMTMERVGITTRKANILNNVFEYYQNGIAQSHILGTAWGAYNGITGYYCNVKDQTGEKRMNNLIFGGDRLAMSKALVEIVNYKQAA